MENNKDLLKYLKNESENLTIPESLEPENMKKQLKQQVAQKAFQRRKTARKWMTAAACLCVFLLGMTAFSISTDKKTPSREELSKNSDSLEEIESPETGEKHTEEEELLFPHVSYEEIYASMETVWKEYEMLARGDDLDVPVENGIRLEAAEEESSAQKQMNSVQELSDSAYGTTNVRTEGIDEGDIVKNDGRYLYQLVRSSKGETLEWYIQIVDTKDGLKEIGQIRYSNPIEEFYVWKNTVIVIQQKYTDYPLSETASRKMSVCYDMAYTSDAYHEITFYDISDRTKPEVKRKFTLQGEYASSRIAEGYFYGFSRYYAKPGNGKEDYDSYIPVLDGKRLQADSIYLPEQSNATSYLVFVTIDLNDPMEFVQTRGIVSAGNLYYVSDDNIFVANSHFTETHEGTNTNTTSILRFSYEKGKIILRARGEVKGQLEGTFSMDESNDHLRLVSTVWEYQAEKLVDDRTGEIIGYETTEETKTNALYVLNRQLQVVGKIEGLAKDEQIYSARFMEDTAYFVTFRLTDPLFTVDLKDPENPKILSELKVSGFSDYLHIYGEDRLLGIGMEADENTGAQQGMKLSMFDISDKTKVTEISKYAMKDYNYSEALYNYHAVMINPEKNIFGFCAEGSQKGKNWRDYFVFSYENDTFVQRLKIDVQTKSGIYDTVRGTFIGDTFYLLKDSGNVQSYDLNTGKLLDELCP